MMGRWSGSVGVRSPRSRSGRCQRRSPPVAARRAPSPRRPRWLRTARPRRPHPPRPARRRPPRSPRSRPPPRRPSAAPGAAAATTAVVTAVTTTPRGDDHRRRDHDHLPRDRPDEHPARADAGRVGRGRRLPPVTPHRRRRLRVLARRQHRRRAGARRGLRHPQLARTSSLPPPSGATPAAPTLAATTTTTTTAPGARTGHDRRPLPDRQPLQDDHRHRGAAARAGRRRCSSTRRSAAILGSYLGVDVTRHPGDGDHRAPAAVAHLRVRRRTSDTFFQRGVDSCPDAVRRGLGRGLEFAPGTTYNVLQHELLRARRADRGGHRRARTSTRSTERLLTPLGITRDAPRGHVRPRPGRR